MFRIGRCYPLGPYLASYAMFAHHASYTWAADLPAFRPQPAVNPGAAVVPARGFVLFFDGFQQGFIGLFMIAGYAFKPLVITTLAYFKYL